MEIQTVKIGNEKLIPSGASREGISVRRSGIAKVLWRKLNVNVPASKVIAGGNVSGISSTEAQNSTDGTPKRQE